MKTGVVISVAGCGSRIGLELPKQFRQLGDKRVVDHTLDNIFATGCFDDVVLVVRPGDRPEYKNCMEVVSVYDAKLAIEIALGKI